MPKPDPNFNDGDEFTVSLRGERVDMQTMGSYMVAWVAQEAQTPGSQLHEAFVKIKLNGPSQCLAFMFHIASASHEGAVLAEDEPAIREFRRILDLTQEVAERLGCPLPIPQSRETGRKH